MASFVTNLGLANVIAAWHAYTSRAKYMQWGVGTGQAVTSTDLADTTGTTEARTDGTTSTQTETTTGDTYQVVGTIVALGTLAITELGLFDAAGTGAPPSGGNMCIYGDFSAINVVADDSITFTVRVTADQA
jgi:hypothetical protein